LTLCLLHAIKESNLNSSYSVLKLKSISKYYGEWIKSEPFDKGKTTFAALGKLKKDPENY
jgi:uncharacterized protein (UPF0305 family)